MAMMDVQKYQCLLLNGKHSNVTIMLRLVPVRAPVSIKTLKLAQHSQRGLNFSKKVKY
jgi:hypothetical protein